MKQLKIYIDDYNGRKSHAFLVNAIKCVNSEYLIIEVYTLNNNYIGCYIKLLDNKSNEISTFSLVSGVMIAVRNSPYEILSNTININYFIMENTFAPCENEIIKGKITL